MSIPTIANSNPRSVSIIDDSKAWTPQSSSSSHSPPSLDNGRHARSTKALRTRVIDSFRRDPQASLTRNTSVHSGENEETFKPYDLESAMEGTASSPLLRQLKGRHLQSMPRLSFGYER